MSEPEDDREHTAFDREHTTPAGDVPGPPAADAQAAAAKARRRFWRLVATATSLGWSLVLPIVAGALLGNYLDKLTGREFIWTVGLLFGGVAISLYNLYHILYKEMNE
jgi:predicted F0F1-ATPase subunit